MGKRWADGGYARRMALYEWLMDKHLEVPSNIGGNYVDALVTKKLVTSSPSQVIKNARWRINDNLAEPSFLSDAVKTEALRKQLHWYCHNGWQT